MSFFRLKSDKLIILWRKNIKFAKFSPSLNQVKKIWKNPFNWLKNLYVPDQNF